MSSSSKNTLLHVASVAFGAFILFGAVATSSWVQQAGEEELQKSLKSALDNAHQGVLQMYRSHQSPALVLANDERVRNVVQRLLKVQRTRAALLAAPEQDLLRTMFAPYANVVGYEGFFIIAKDGVSLASMRDVNIGGENLLVSQGEYLKQIWAGKSLMSQPIKSDVPLTDRHGHIINGLATMFTSTPIQDEVGATIAVLAIRISPDDSFGPIFSRARFGESGETYAVNAAGVMLSESRFNDHLSQSGLLDDPHHADLMLEVRDPGVDLTQGKTPVLKRENQPLTKMAREISARRSGIDLNGYRDYRGVSVVGAWVWDDQLGYGIATEINATEAFEEHWRTTVTIYAATVLLLITMVGLWWLAMAVRKEVELSAMLAEQAQKAAEKGKSEANLANQAKSEFLSSMSHELRTPLNAITGFAQLLEYANPPLTAHQLEQVRDIRKGGDHLLSLINDILDLSKIEAGKLDISIEPVTVDEVVQQCIDMIEPQTDKYEITLDNRINLDDVEVMSDHLRLRQCLLNLMSNAVKYNRPGGRVTLAAEKVEGHWLRVLVSDNGIGISDKHKGKMFEAFNRLGAEASGVEGTGIGLSLTRTLIEKMGGRIGFTSVEGEGSTFWLDMPLVRSSRPQAAEKQSVDLFSPRHDASEPVERAGVAGGAERLVLYVEDNLANIRIVRGILCTLSHYKLITAQNAEDGIELARKASPDLILMDGTLPNMSGNEAVRRLKACSDTKDIPVIGLSANAMEKDQENAMDAGCSAYLTKPIDIEQFIATVQQTLRA